MPPPRVLCRESPPLALALGPSVQLLSLLPHLLTTLDMGPLP